MDNILCWDGFLWKIFLWFPPMSIFQKTSHTPLMVLASCPLVACLVSCLLLGLLAWLAWLARLLVVVWLGWLARCCLLVWVAHHSPLACCSLLVVGRGWLSGWLGWLVMLLVFLFSDRKLAIPFLKKSWSQEFKRMIFIGC